MLSLLVVPVVFLWLDDLELGLKRLARWLRRLPPEADADAGVQSSSG